MQQSALSSTKEKIIPILPSLMKNESATGRVTLSPVDGRRVSFELDSPYFDVGSVSFLTLNPTFAIPSLKEEKRVVSNETIHAVPNNKDMESTLKSKSLTSLTRSGDLKSLLDKTGFLKTPAVSEDCLSSSMHEDDEREIMYSSSGSLHDINPSRSEETQAILTNSPCSSGWGQFVEFIPLDHKHIGPSSSSSSTRSKRISPARRRRSSLTTKSSYRRKRLHEQQLTQHANINILSNCNEQRMLPIISQSSKMYNRSKHTVTVLTNDIVDAFRNQLSLKQPN